MPVAGQMSDPAYEMNRNVDRMLHLYHNRHYRIIHEEIRSMKWFIEDLTSSYRSVPSPLYDVIIDMGQKSPSFFDNLIQSRTPADLLERFRLSLYPFSFIPDMQDDWRLLILIHQLYADALARDMKGGRLAEGFCNPLKEIRLMLKNTLSSRN